MFSFVVLCPLGINVNNNQNRVGTLALGNRSARVPPLPSLPTGDEQILDNSMFESLGTEVDEDDDLLNDNTSTISKINQTQFDIRVDPCYKTKIRSNELCGTIQEWIDVSTGKE